MEPLVDGWGRKIGSVRVSVTDKCNFRCTYCMPAEGLEWLRRDEILSFEEITRRDALDQVLAGLAEAERYPELRPIKVNCVSIKGFTEDEVPALAGLARRKPYVVRFIEFMPLDADRAWSADQVLTGGEIRALSEEQYGPLVEVPARPWSTARRFRFPAGKGERGL